MRRTFSWKRISDQQIARALGIDSGASAVAKLMTVTGYPADKCLLALEHAKRRGLIVRDIDGRLMVSPTRLRSAINA